MTDKRSAHLERAKMCGQSGEVAGRLRQDEMAMRLGLGVGFCVIMQ